MSYLSIGNVKISGISACVPKEVEEVISFPLFTLDNAENFTKTTGVERRRKAPFEVCSSDLCFKAASVLLPGSKNTVKMGIGVQQNREQEYSKNGNKNTVISINIINQGLHCIINKKQDCDGLKNKITYHYVSRDSQAS